MIFQRPIVIFAVAIALAGTAGCTSNRWSKLSNPFDLGRDDSTKISDPLFANTKAGQVQEIRQIAAQAKSQSPAEQAQSAKSLVTRIQSEDDKVLRLEIIRALGTLRSPIATEGLRLAIADSRDAVRVATCDALGEIRTEEALTILGSVVGSDPNLDVRVAATKAIAKYDGPSAISALQPAINDADPALQFTAVQALKKLHHEDLGNSVAAWQDLARTIGSNGNTAIAEEPSADWRR